MGGAGRVGADQHLPAGPASRSCPGTCANAFLVTAMWSAAVFDPALPGRSIRCSGSPVPAWPWSTNAHNGWNP